MNYELWDQSIPADIGWQDVTKLMQDRRTVELSDQLYRAFGSVSANISEGYSRGSRTDRAWFYEYARGSARESRDWYYKGTYVLSGDVLKHRLSVLTQIIRLLLKMVPQQRGRTMHETGMTYELDVHEVEEVQISRITHYESRSS